MIEPTPEQRRLMTWWERMNFRFCDWVNHRYGNFHMKGFLSNNRFCRSPT